MKILTGGESVHHGIKEVSSGIAITKLSRNYLLKRKFKNILHRSLIETDFCYGNVVWRKCGEALLTRLQNLQNRAVGVITHSEIDTPVDQLIHPLTWKTVTELIINDMAVMMYKSLDDLALFLLK